MYVHVCLRVRVHVRACVHACVCILTEQEEKLTQVKVPKYESANTRGEKVSVKNLVS